MRPTGVQIDGGHARARHPRTARPFAATPLLPGAAGAPRESKDFFLRKDFSRSSLVRLLDTWAPGDASASRQDVAQQLSEWVDVSGAITLHAAHQGLRPSGPGKAGPALQAAARTLQEQVGRTRADLVSAISAGARLPATGAEDDGFAPVQQRCQELQRQMALRIEALRGHARQVLARACPPLAPLADLDGVLEQLLGARESKLMATVPMALERRFEALRAGPLTTDDAAEPSPGWPPAFAADLQKALLAELEVRLQPVMGMMDALNQELEKHR